MPVPFVIIDGYNLMHAAGLARLQYGPGDLQRVRERFLRELAGQLPVDERGRTTVVFDAFDAPSDLPRSQIVEGIQVYFANPGSDADTQIEELLAAHSAPRQVWIVSDDHRLQRAAHRRRARGVSSADYWAGLQHRAAARESSADSAPPVPAKFTGRPSPSETEYWLNVFGDALDPDKSEPPP